jgi:D-alanyl-D-alanine carboxypeptidase
VTPVTATFPTEAFADISEEPVSEGSAATFQAILDEAIAAEAVAAGGITATVMTANGTWTGAVGRADGIRDMRPDDQMAIGSITKSVIAAQIMQLVEAGELALDDPATKHLPADLDFDTNGATLHQLLGMRSGIPDYVDALWPSLSTDRQHSWTPAEVLALVPANRSAAGARTEYSSTNYVLLGLIIQQVRGRRLAVVLRDGVLRGDGLERLIYQPDEAPSEPMAMPGGGSTAELEQGGGYLPSLAGATAGGPAGAIASDSSSLARWWSRRCSGEIVSEASLTEMTTFQDWYGLGLDGRVDS